MKARKARVKLAKRIASYERVHSLGPVDEKSVWVRPQAKQGAPFVFHKPGSMKK